jgi:phosphoribosylanthranilate isomerase
MRVKFCGTASLADILCAVDAGCDALGFIMGVRHQSSDVVTPAEAAKMVRQIPPFIEPVAVTHLQETEDLIRLVEDSCCTTLQIQDFVEPSEIEIIRDALPYVKIVKAVHVTDESAVNVGKRYEPYADALILDTRTREKIGGTGIPHDWAISATIVANSAIPVILAGGLTPENVAEAIRKVRPYGVDVHTGVKKDGVRNPERTLAFAREARNALSGSRNDGPILSSHLR